MKKILTALFLFLAFTPFAHAQQSNSAVNPLIMVRAQVVSVQNHGKQNVPGTGVSDIDQTLEAKILDGNQAGNVVTLDNDYTQLSVGEEFYMQITSAADGSE